jgi:Mg2+/Co2+ transporter CorB
MEVPILIIASVLAVLMAVGRSFVYTPTSLSQFELERRAAEQDHSAAYELKRRKLFPALRGAHVLLMVVLDISLLAVLMAGLPLFWAIIAAVVLRLLVEFAGNHDHGWLSGMAMAIQRATEPSLIGAIAALSGFLRLFSYHMPVRQAAVVGSRDELVHIIDHDTSLLDPAEKARIQGALQFGTLRIRDVMVPRSEIASVSVAETVGPVLLDRLHKASHKIFIVVKKDLDHIQGLLYMADATSGHPDLKTVRDAVRKSVVYLPEDEHLETVLGASCR